MEDTLRVKMRFLKIAAIKVLILVLMEDTLRDGKVCKVYDWFVLILVLMEDTLRVMRLIDKSYSSIVLILVLMEDTLRGKVLK